MKNKINSSQWNGIIGYAKYSNGHQLLPTALFVTFAATKDESIPQKVIEAGVKKGVYPFFLTLLPNFKVD